MAVQFGLSECAVAGRYKMNIHHTNQLRRSGANLTAKQVEVLSRVAKRHTIKQIAHELGVTESAVNQRIKLLKTALGASSLSELASIYSEISNDSIQETCRKPAYRKKQLPPIPKTADPMEQNDAEPALSFHEPLHYRIPTPWESLAEQGAVPGVLNGAHAGWVRGAAIVAIALGFFVTVLVGLGAAQGITSALATWHSAPETKM